MDTELFSRISDDLPKFNPEVCKGLAVKQLKQVESYLVRVVECAARSWPAGLTFEGCEPCTPEEEHREIVRKRYQKHQYEMLRNDFFMVKLHLKHKGVDLPPRMLFLPYVDEGGSIHIRGTKFWISPVLADVAISVDRKGLFIPLTRDRVNFERTPFNFISNGTRESVSIIHSGLYRAKQDGDGGQPMVSAFTTLAHYLFAKYGVTETFRRYTNTEIKVSDNGFEGEELSPDEWVICRSTGLKPMGVRDRGWTPSNVEVAVRLTDYTSVVKSLIAGFFYVADYFPDRVKVETIDSTRRWRIILGLIKYGAGCNEGRIVEEFDVHIDSLDEYIDPLAIDALKRGGIHVEDIWTLFMYVIENMSDMMIHTDISSMYQKILITLRYVMFDITKSIFMFTWAVQAAAQRHDLTEQRILQLWDKKVRYDCITQLNNRHGEVNTITVAGDNMIPKITGNCVLQSNVNGTHGTDSAIGDPAKVLHASQADVGSYQKQPKSDPTGRSCLNPMVQIDDVGMVIPREEFKGMHDSIQGVIRRN